MKENKLTDATISIGGIDFHLSSSGPEAAFDVEPGYLQFLSPGDPGAVGIEADVTLSVRVESPPDVDDAEQIFDTGSNWKLLRRDGQLMMPISSPALEPHLYKMLVIDAGLEAGDIYMAPGTRQINPHSAGGGQDSEVLNYPFQYPLDEVLMVNLLSRGKGVEIHGLGIDMGGKGFLFTGTSGAGKSTLAELWKQRADNSILSDDRLIVRPDSTGGPGDFLLYGTPWHGDAGVSAPGGIPLRRILILNQARENRLVELSTAEAATSLLVRCFPTFWDHRGMEFTMDFIGRLCAAVPCYELRFLPEQSALDTAIENL